MTSILCVGLERSRQPFGRLLFAFSDDQGQFCGRTREAQRSQTLCKGGIMRRLKRCAYIKEFYGCKRVEFNIKEADTRIILHSIYSMHLLQLPKVIIHANGIDTTTQGHNTCKWHRCQCCVQQRCSQDCGSCRWEPSTTSTCRFTILQKTYDHHCADVCLYPRYKWRDIVSHPHHTGKDMVDSFFPV